jgi:hypothetical protein
MMNPQGPHSRGWASRTPSVADCRLVAPPHVRDRQTPITRILPVRVQNRRSQGVVIGSGAIGRGARVGAANPPLGVNGCGTEPANPKRTEPAQQQHIKMNTTTLKFSLDGTAQPLMHSTARAWKLALATALLWLLSSWCFAGASAPAAPASWEQALEASLEAYGQGNYAQAAGALDAAALQFGEHAELVFWQGRVRLQQQDWGRGSEPLPTLLPTRSHQRRGPAPACERPGRVGQAPGSARPATAPAVHLFAGARHACSCVPRPHGWRINALAAQVRQK